MIIRFRAVYNERRLKKHWLHFSGTLLGQSFVYLKGDPDVKKREEKTHVILLETKYSY